MGMVQRVTLVNAFDATGKYVPEGHIGTFDEDKITDKDIHLVDPGELPGVAQVQMAAIAPTGPNPQQPQQVPPDARQGPGGGYMTPGKQLVGEVTKAQEDRLEAAGLTDQDLEAAVSEALRKIAAERGIPLAEAGVAALGVANGADAALLNNNDDALVDGTVKEVTSDLGTKTNEQLQAMLAAEKDREKPRTGVTTAIQTELDERAEKAKTQS